MQMQSDYITMVVNLKDESDFVYIFWNRHR